VNNFQDYLTPEQKARKNIDKMLELSGCAVQNKDKIDFSASFGIADYGYFPDCASKLSPTCQLDTHRDSGAKVRNQ